MKTIGICIPTIEGGVVCHQEIGREAMRRGVPYPPIVTQTPLYEGIKNAVKTDNFDALSTVLSDSVNSTAKAGAEFAIIPSNTPHIVFPETLAKSTIPVLSILEVTADHCVKLGCKRVGILGTSPTVRRRLYDEPLEKRGIATVYVPDAEQDYVHDAIQNELIKGIFTDQTRDGLVLIAKQLAPQCDAIVLGCTELPLILTEENCQIKVVDTTRVLSHAALDFAIKE
jgi:aspartate racemase